MKKTGKYRSGGFTLVELIIVVGIIGVLMTVMLATFSGGTETARAAKCLNNMRNLAQASMSYAAGGEVGDTTGHRLPLAGSRVAIRFDSKGLCYKEQVGWISWLSQNDEYKTRSKKSETIRSYISVQNASAYTTDDKAGLFAITNGSIWRSVNYNKDIYVCPEHKLAVNKKGGKVWWSYVMNAYFGYDYSNGSKATVTDGDIGKAPSDASVRPDRRLMFAELPIYGSGTRIDEGGKATGASYSTGTDPKTDCVLQYKNGQFHSNWKGSAESIAFNHKSNKRWCAHVVFADGHAEKLLKPKSGGVDDEELTVLLCSGKDLSFDGKSYTWLNNNDKSE